MTLRYAFSRLLAMSWALCLSSTLVAADLSAPTLTGTMPPLPQTLPQPTAAEPVRIQTPANQAQLDAMMNSTFTAKGFSIQGVASLPRETIVAKYQPLIGQTISVKQLMEVTGEVTRMYQEKGYVLSFAFVPQQDLNQGVVQVVVVEGHVGSVRIEGEMGPLRERLLEMLEAIRAEKPLRSATFERTNALLNMLPGLKAEVSVPPPTTVDGASQMLVKIARRSQFAISPGLVANGGAVRAGFSAQLRSLTPLAEQLSISAYPSFGEQKDQYYAASYSQLLGSSGLGIKLDASLSKQQPEDAVISGVRLHRDRRVERAGLTFSYPVWLQNVKGMAVTLGMYATDDRDEYRNPQNGATLAVHSQVRAVQLETVYSQTGASRTLKANLGVAKGFDLGGARSEFVTQTATEEIRTAGNVNVAFFRAFAGATLAQVLPASFSTVLTLAGQYSHDVLPPSEQIAFGAQRFGLGYPSGELSGDSGWGASLELGRTFTLDTRLLKMLRPYLMYDTARGYSNGFALTHDKLASVAAGLRFSDNKYYSLDLAVAKPVGQRPIQEGDRPLRLNASFSSQFE